MGKYTFLLPAYKAQFLNNALLSIQQQSYRDFKVIISNDCSPEDLLSVVTKYLQDERFSYICQDKNLGGTSLVTHWNKLIELCDSEFLILASDDDVYAPSFLQEINSLVQKYPTFDLFRSRVERIDENGKLLIVEGRCDETVDQLHYMYQSYRNDVIPCVSNNCYRTSALKAIGGFVVFPLAWFSDDATNILMAKRGCANTADVLFKFRWSDISITFSKPTQETACKKLDATILYDEWFKKHLNDVVGQCNLAEPLLPDRIRNFHMKKILEMIPPYTNVLSVWKFIMYCRKLKQKCNCDIKPLLFLYFRHII